MVVVVVVGGRLDFVREYQPGISTACQVINQKRKIFFPLFFSN
jgi:hypothetical protein